MNHYRSTIDQDVPIVQWIEHLRPKEQIYVRIVVGIPKIIITKFSVQYNHFKSTKQGRQDILMLRAMAQKYFEDQLDNEELLYVFRKHPIVMRRGLIISMFAILLGTVPSLIKPEYVYLFGGLATGFLLAGLLFLPSWISWFYSVFIVTDQRLIQITQKGLWKRSVVDIGLNQIQMVNYEVAGFQETLLGFGTIMMQTFVGDLVIHDVHHPAKTQKKLLTILREKGIIANAPPMVTTETPDEA
jgi:hypothetical protein